VIAALAGFPLLLGAAGGLLVAAVAVALAGRAPAIGSDTAVAVVVTGLFGLGALLALSRDTPAGLGELLSGDILGLGDGDLALAAGLVVVVLGVLWVAHHGLLTVGFDRSTAAALGRAPLAADVLLGLLLAAALLVAVQGLGNLLVVAVLVAPAAAARRLARRMGTMMVIAIVIAALAGVAGVYASYHLHTAAGASIAAALVSVYVLAEAGTALRGVPEDQ
jgi:ABC-type Mn2+/Zn2+ transport system permease subunit